MFIQELTLKNLRRVSAQEKRWAKMKPLLERQNKIRQEQQELMGKRINTSKLLIIFLFANCTIIELFTMFIIYKNVELAEFCGVTIDFSPLNTLIGAVIGEVVSFAIYSIKAAKENCKNGITYELAMQRKEREYNDNEISG